MSLSARRAWIEIRLRNVPAITLLNVALRKESVDRNDMNNRVIIKTNRSLSARRAWIEIQKRWTKLWRDAVALRKESVDRNSL